MKEEAASASRETETTKERQKDGSIIIVIATDVSVSSHIRAKLISEAPLLPIQLKRLAARENSDLFRGQILTD
jgi:L-aminopeptidase/D-esterase-like protein